jgi:uncharacterized protein
MKKHHALFVYRIFCILAVLLVFSGKVFGDTANSFLWKVEGKGSTAYVLGSIHVANKDFYPLSQTIETAFDSSPMLAVEVNINDIDPLSMTSLVVETAMYKNGETMKDHLSPETYDLVAKKLEEYGIDISTLNQSKPWFAAMMISNLELQKMGFDPLYGIDKHFLDLAEEKNKKIVELESFDFQIRLLDQFTDKDQELFLSYEIMNDEAAQKETQQLIDAWKTGDASGMEALLYQPLKENPDLLPVYTQLFYDRNAAIAAKIEEYLSTKETHFVVVGSGHLVGEKGIISLLQRKGYTVTQL